MKQSTIDAVHDGLWMVVNGAGTGGRGRIVEGRDVAGKTGTAQVISNQGKARAGKTDRDLRDHGWFVFFAPAKNPRSPAWCSPNTPSTARSPRQSRST